MTEEEKRLEENGQGTAPWKRWGPYLSERQWGTVREDYSADGDPWSYFPHDHARSRAYRWGEDGLAGISDREQLLCFGIALWNEHDPFLKERLFGLENEQGNHGEDVKEYYFYLDNTPTHSSMKCLYKYPQAAFPYERLVKENQKRNRQDDEYELIDTGVFDEDRYFDVSIEYAKARPDDILIRIELINRGPVSAPIHLLPTFWFRNIWSWYLNPPRPTIDIFSSTRDVTILEVKHNRLGNRWLYFERPIEILFTENTTNLQRLFGVPNPIPYVKDAFHDYLVDGDDNAVNPASIGTKAAGRYRFELGSSEQKTVNLRLSDRSDINQPFGHEFEESFQARREEADRFYERISSFPLSDELRAVQRQAFAGLLWNKQFYHYDVPDWLHGDPASPPPPTSRLRGRNHHWIHFNSHDIISMPDKWEYPWFAAWDLAFHTLPLVMIDPDFAKEQLTVLTREWYMHPNGQLPAYEWAFDDANPPVHAWAAYRIYKIEEKMYGKTDREFLERIFQKLLINFTWWVNRKDAEGNNIFEGGFLGLDNIGIFDRNAPLPTGGNLEQADATSWMGMYCLDMLSIALELSMVDPVYEDIATKFFEHFVYIANAINGGTNADGLWDEENGYYFDVIRFPDGRQIPLKQYSMVGMIPLFAVATGDLTMIEKFPGFRMRAEWFAKNRPDLVRNFVSRIDGGVNHRFLLSVVTPEKLRRMLKEVLSEDSLLGPYGVRSVSRRHLDHPLIFEQNGQEYRLDYEPAESRSGLFGGNSNWRGPVWLPLNYLLIESLQKYHYFLGDQFTVECPTGSGVEMNLWQVASFLSQRSIDIFISDPRGIRPLYGEKFPAAQDPDGRDLVLFYEYFNGDNGKGLGASHQTGWTGLIAKLIQQQAEYQSTSPLQRPI